MGTRTPKQCEKKCYLMKMADKAGKPLSGPEKRTLVNLLSQERYGFVDEINWTAIVNNWPDEIHESITAANLKIRFTGLLRRHVPLHRHLTFSEIMEVLNENFMREGALGIMCGFEERGDELSRDSEEMGESSSPVVLQEEQEKQEEYTLLEL